MSGHVPVQVQTQTTNHTHIHTPSASGRLGRRHLTRSPIVSRTLLSWSSLVPRQLCFRSSGRTRRPSRPPRSVPSSAHSGWACASYESPPAHVQSYKGRTSQFLASFRPYQSITSPPSPFRCVRASHSPVIPLVFLTPAHVGTSCSSIPLSPLLILQTRAGPLSTLPVLPCSRHLRLGLSQVRRSGFECRHYSTTSSCLFTPNRALWF